MSGERDGPHVACSRWLATRQRGGRCAAADDLEVCHAVLHQMNPMHAVRSSGGVGRQRALAKELGGPG